VGIHIKEIRQNEGSALKTTDNTKYVQQERRSYNYSGKYCKPVRSDKLVVNHLHLKLISTTRIAYAL
jgi:hypothetical protein